MPNSTLHSSTIVVYLIAVIDYPSLSCKWDGLAVQTMDTVLQYCCVEGDVLCGQTLGRMVLADCTLVQMPWYPLAAFLKYSWNCVKH